MNFRFRSRGAGTVGAQSQAQGGRRIRGRRRGHDVELEQFAVCGDDLERVALIPPQVLKGFAVHALRIILAAPVLARRNAVRSMQLDCRPRMSVRIVPRDVEAVMPRLEHDHAAILAGRGTGRGVAHRFAPVERVGAVRFDAAAQRGELHFRDPVGVVPPGDVVRVLQHAIGPIAGPDGPVPKQV